jgi:hypothetical protein
MDRAKLVYPTREPYELVLFDFRVRETGSRLRREAYAWKSSTSIERLDRHHAVMIVRPGGAKEIVG